MIAVQGTYDNGIISLKNVAPVTKANVLVIFPDEVEISSKKEYREALKNDTFVISTGLNADDYVKELRDDERI